MQEFFHLLEFLAEAFQCYMYKFQCLVVPVVLAVISLFSGSRWLGQQRCQCGWCVCVRVCEFCNVIGHLVCRLEVVYNVCISHIIRWYLHSIPGNLVHDGVASYCVRTVLTNCVSAALYSYAACSFALKMVININPALEKNKAVSRH